MTYFPMTVGPVVTCVSLMCNDDLVVVLWLHDAVCDGPATGEGVVVSASECEEPVCVCGVCTHVTHVGVGSIVDVYYTV